MYVWMDGRMDGRMNVIDGWFDGRMGRGRGGWIDGLEGIDGWMNG